MGKKGRVFSGARPTGRQHLGNYLGAIKNYVALQDKYDCVYCVVDLHALTTLKDTEHLRVHTYEMVLDWLAAGMDPEDTIIFVQSHVPQVTELHTILSMVTPMGWLTRLPTFKEKVRQQTDNVNYGLLGYPVLMAADIVLYKAEFIPVGEDQLPHIELTREIARRFNSLFGNTFPEPEAKLTSFPLIVGLDGKEKMSKQLDNHIEIALSDEETVERVMTAVTDPARRYRDDPGHPDICNIYQLQRYFNPLQLDDIGRRCRAADIGCVDCKMLLAQEINSTLKPFRERRAALATKPKYITDVMADGASRASVIARKTLKEVKQKMGLI